MTERQQRVQDVYQRRLIESNSYLKKLQELNLRIQILENELLHYKEKASNKSIDFEGDIFDEIFEEKKSQYTSAKRYIVKIKRIEFIKTFEFNNTYLNNYLVELEEFDGKFILNQFVDTAQVITGTIISCFFDNEKIKNFKIISNPDDETC
jgi:hypothetical protein